MSEEEKTELEELYENSEWWHNRFNAVQRDYENLQKRIDKAIDWCDEIIRTFCEDDKQVVVAYEIKEILGDKENE